MKKDLPIEIDWDSFCNHPKYTQQDEVSQLTRIVENAFSIISNAISDVNSNSSFAGLCKVDKIFKEGR